MPDPLEALRGQPVIPAAPRQEFARDLRRRLEEAIRTVQGDQVTTALTTRPLMPAMAYIASPDPDASTRFFGELFDWATIRTEGEHVNQYVYNVDVGEPVRTGHRGHTMPVVSGSTNEHGTSLQFAVDNLQESVERAKSLGGRVTGDAADGYASVDDGAGPGFVLWQAPRPGDYPSPPTARIARAVPSYFELWTGDPGHAARFWSELLGWIVEPAGPDLYQLTDVGKVAFVVGIATDERSEGVRHYLGVDHLDEVIAELTRRGGTAGRRYITPGGVAVECTDPYGATLRLVTAG